VKALRSRRFNDPELQRFFDEVEAWLTEALKQRVMHDGTVFEGVQLTTTNREFSHNLGRIPTRVFPLHQNANAVVYVDTAHADPRNKVYVKASATVTVNLLVA
jgi:hypothetical protein